jgi:hypothetical protein
MENELVMVIVAVLLGLIILTIVLLVLRVVWMIVHSPVAFATMVALLALTASLVALSSVGPL